MENNQQPAIAQEVDNAAMHPRSVFTSTEAMKDYYLQFANILNVRYVEGPSEFMSLNCLHRRLIQYIHAVQLINTHEWGKGIAEIQNACGAYLLQSNMDKKKLLQTNEEIGLHLQFISQLAGKVGFLKQLEGILHYHNQNVEYLLKRLKEEQKQLSLQE